jgi:hypothetical protein
MKKKIVKENEYSLVEIMNYNELFNYDENKVIKKYLLLINEYIKFILEKTKIKNNKLLKFIIIRGCYTVTNVFNNILYYTKNLDLTFYHCQKAYYYYIEFIEQITDEQHVFLQLTSRDASVYVYKKIFSELLYNSNKHITSDEDNFKKKLLLIDEHIKMFNIIFYFIIENLNLNEYNLNIIKNNYFKTIFEKINTLNIELEHCKVIYNLIEKINKSLENYDDVLIEYNKLLINILTKYAKYKNNIHLFISKV